MIYLNRGPMLSMQLESLRVHIFEICQADRCCGSSERFVCWAVHDWAHCFAPNHEVV